MAHLNGWAGRILKLGMIAGLVAGIALIGLGKQGYVLAQDGAQTFVVEAGAYGPMNSEVLTFAPVSLQVHRGDTIVWMIDGFHNIHFGDQPTEFVIVSEVDGQPLPQYNPLVSLPSIESGSVYTGGDVSSGLPDITGALMFSLTVDLEPGTYAYYCDVHPGMAGTLEVVADDVPIPSPFEAAQQAAAEISGGIGQGMGAAAAALQLSSAPAEEGATEHHIMMGAAAGRATSQMFFPQTTYATVGDTIIFEIPADSNDGHNAAWPPAAPEDLISIVETDSGPPILALGPGMLPTGADGMEISPTVPFNTGVVFPGASFSVIVTEPGLYNYICNLHPGMVGAIVAVEPSS